MNRCIPDANSHSHTSYNQNSDFQKRIRALNNSNFHYISRLIYFMIMFFPFVNLNMLRHFTHRMCFKFNSESRPAIYDSIMFQVFQWNVSQFHRAYVTILIHKYQFPNQMRSLLSATWNSKNNCFSIRIRNENDTMYDTIMPGFEQCYTRKIFVHFIAFLYAKVTTRRFMNFHCNHLTSTMIVSTHRRQFGTMFKKMPV